MREPKTPSNTPDGADARLASETASSDPFRRLLHRVRTTDAATLGHQVRLTEVPAPPFGEEERARVFAELLAEAGARDVRVDEEGNVVGRLEGAGSGPSMVVAAHLDTVFPEGTPVSVHVDGDRLRGPGISDDGRGLAALLAVVRCLSEENVKLSRSLLVAGTVGEEGVGNLRGVRHLFSERGRARDSCAFISLDGAGGTRIVTRGVGSRRFRVRLVGPGGHSWVDWGTANPIHTLAKVIAGVSSVPLPPGATLSVGRISGGIAVNAIPEEAWMELEIRSVEEPVLDGLEGRVAATVRDGVERANQDRKEGSAELALEWHVLGSRPAGRTRSSSPLVRAAVAATRETVGEAELVASSTDANVPMSLGVPAVTMGAGGESGQAHTVEEWYRNTGGPEGIARVLLTLLVFDRLAPG